MSENILLQNYKVISQIGKGGFSTAYLAVDSDDKECVIKKITLDKYDYSLFSAIEREIKVLKEVSHPQIPKFIDFFKEENEKSTDIYIIQEYINARNLKDWIYSGKVFTENEIKNITLKILKVIEYLHNFLPQIIHRDIKPSNILLNENNEVFLIDFGAVKEKVTYGNISRSGISTIIGTQGYMPLEQFEGRANTSSDFYSLGLTLIYLLSHKEPLQLPKDGLTFSLKNIINVSDDFMIIIERMVEPDYTKRYSTVFEVKRAINQIGNKLIKKTKNEFSEKSIADLAKQYMVEDEEIIFIDRPSIKQVLKKASSFSGVGRGIVIFMGSLFILFISLILLKNIGIFNFFPIIFLLVGFQLNLISIGLISRPYFMIKMALNTAYVVTNKKVMIISQNKKEKKIYTQTLLSTVLGIAAAIGRGYSIISVFGLLPIIMIRIMENNTNNDETKQIIGYLELPKFIEKDILKNFVIERHEYKNGSGDLTFYDNNFDKNVPALKIIGLDNVRRFEKLIIELFK